MRQFSMHCGVKAKQTQKGGGPARVEVDLGLDAMVLLHLSGKR